LTPPEIWLANPNLKDKQGCTTRYVGLSYPRVLFNSFGPSSRNASDKFKGWKEDRRRQKTEDRRQKIIIIRTGQKQ
jgi:hypothetical protein